MQKTQSSFYTIGYEGRKIEEFLGNLSEHNVQTIVDVREIPLSRKKGFSKNALQQKLAECGIEYIHIKALGSPSNLRKKVYKDKDYDYFFDNYEKHLENCQEELECLYKVIEEKVSCLLCFEGNPAYCHRSSVANKISRLNGTTFQIRHI